MPCTEAYREHIMYTFHSFCKVVIRNAAITAWHDQQRRHKREISLEYLTTGCLVNFKTEKVSYKVKQSKENPAEKQVIFENHHEPIVDQETWERVQELRKQRKRTNLLTEGVTENLRKVTQYAARHFSVSQ